MRFALGRPDSVSTPALSHGGAPPRTRSVGVRQHSIQEQLLRRNAKQFQGGLVFKARRLVVSFNSRPRVIKKKKKSQAAVHPCVCLKSDLLPASSYTLSRFPRSALCAPQPVAFAQGWYQPCFVTAFTSHALSRCLPLLCSAWAHQPSASDAHGRSQASGRVGIQAGSVS